MARAAPIYVELRIRADMQELWRVTQTPELHQRWDLRFTEIEYLPRPDPEEPQRFLYSTRIGLGLRIEGQGESLGERLGSDGRASSLRFSSEDPKSLIREGAGFWKYIPTDDGVRFLTRYDYSARYGRLGELLGRFVLRPLMGWATAWSFDRLRLWLERGITPEVSMQRSIVHALCRVSLALVWIYQGVVPKLLFSDISGELDTVRAMGLFEGHEVRALSIVGVLEIAVGCSMLLLWRHRGLLAMNVIALLVLGLAAASADPLTFVGQFNVATLNLSMIALALIGWIVSGDLPTSKNCLRKPPQDDA